MAYEPYELTEEELATLATHDALASRWASLSDPKFVDQFMDVLIRRFRENALVLDLGCGIGLDGELLLARGFRYAGIDLSPAMIGAAMKQLGAWRRRRRAVLATMNMVQLAFRDETFDAFWSLQSCMHVPRRKLPSVLDEAWRVLKPSGAGLLTVPWGEHEGMYRSPKTGRETLITAWQPNDLYALLTARFGTVAVTDVVSRAGRSVIAVVGK